MDLTIVRPYFKTALEQIKVANLKSQGSQLARILSRLLFISFHIVSLVEKRQELFFNNKIVAAELMYCPAD